MTTEQIEHIKAYIKDFNKLNPAKQYVPQRDSENYVYIFGVSSGVVLVPQKDNDITFTILSENDEQYLISDNPLHVDSAWLHDLSHCLNIAQGYLSKNAVKNSDMGYGYKLPYKNKEDEITEFFTSPPSGL